MNTAPHLPIKVQYFCDATPPGIACREENFERRELQFELPVAQTALVLVDLWNVHHIYSCVERETSVLKEKFLRVIEAARESWVTLVQAPSPEVIRNQEKLQKRVYGGWSDPDMRRAPADWPPTDFMERSGDYHAFRHPRQQPPGVQRFWDKLDGQMDISPLVEIADSDYLVATGDQLHALLREQEVLHILYAGFATNWCILGRDYGVAPMYGRGYNVILLRDATEGVEFPDTLEQGWATELAVREVEQKYGYTATSADLIAACGKARP